MYELFDNFLDHHHWSGRHPQEKKRFFSILDKIVRRPDFRVYDMRDYFLKKLQISSYDQHHPLFEAIEHYHHAAQAVRDYLDATAPDRFSTDTKPE